MKNPFAVLAAVALLGAAPYGHAVLPHSSAALREVAERDQCGARFSAPRPYDTRVTNAFDDVVGASATVNVYVDADGRVVAADVVSESDDITGPAAVALLRAQRFHPASCGRRAAAGVYQARFNM